MSSLQKPLAMIKTKAIIPIYESDFNLIVLA